VSSPPCPPHGIESLRQHPGNVEKSPELGCVGHTGRAAESAVQSREPSRERLRARKGAEITRHGPKSPVPRPSPTIRVKKIKKFQKSHQNATRRVYNTPWKAHVLAVCLREKSRGNIFCEMLPWLFCAIARDLSLARIPRLPAEHLRAFLFRGISSAFSAR
jgi:hypothetical protein